MGENNMEEYLQVGKIVNTHGVKGEVKLIPLTDDPHRFDELDWVYVEKGSIRNRHTIEDVKYAKGSVILKLSGIDTMEAAESLRDSFITIDRANAVKLPEDSFFICDLIGCTVMDEKGAELGKIDEILQTGSNDVYVIKNKDGKELLLPALKSVVRKVSIDLKQIEVTVPKGLLDD
jgi:16S rRNA processing protein RimM